MCWGTSLQICAMLSSATGGPKWQNPQAHWLVCISYRGNVHALKQTNKQKNKCSSWWICSVMFFVFFTAVCFGVEFLNLNKWEHHRRTTVFWSQKLMTVTYFPRGHFPSCQAIKHVTRRGNQSIFLLAAFNVKGKPLIAICSRLHQSHRFVVSCFTALAGLLEPWDPSSVWRRGATSSSPPKFKSLSQTSYRV